MNREELLDLIKNDPEVKRAIIKAVYEELKHGNLLPVNLKPITMAVGKEQKS